MLAFGFHNHANNFFSASSKVIKPAKQSTMSQWLTSGRNRLIEKQQQKQRFGNQQGVSQVVSRESQRGAVSTGKFKVIFLRKKSFSACGSPLRVLHGYFSSPHARTLCRMHDADKTNYSLP